MRREQLLDAARHAFVANGLAGARMRQIALAADVDPALLYRHFPSKHALFEAAVLEPLEDLVGDLLEEGLRLLEAPPGHKFEHLERGITRLLEVMGSLAPLVATALFADQEFGAKLYNERVCPLLEAVAQAVAKDLATWAQRPIDPVVVVTSMFTMCFGLAMDARFRGRSLDVAPVAREITSLVTLGLQVGRLPYTARGSAA